MSPAEVVIDVFGGIRAAARAVSIEASTVLRWTQRRGGRIPHEYMHAFLEAAARRHKRLMLEELVWGRPAISRSVVTFDLDKERPTPKNALGHMAQALTA